MSTKIHPLLEEARYEYGEMNITQLNHNIDDIKDEIYMGNIKLKKETVTLDETFDDMLSS
jgi:hypothetical protein